LEILRVIHSSKDSSLQINLSHSVLTSRNWFCFVWKGSRQEFPYVDERVAYQDAQDIYHVLFYIHLQLTPY
jgi:hypothetical protein